MRIRHLFHLGIAGIVLWAPSLLALNGRSAVSAHGLDTNPCTTTQPCRSFTAAIAATNPGGEVIALDSAGYGPFTVSVPLTIGGAPGVHAAITTTAGAGISVAASATDTITLENLVLIGAGGSDGIVAASAKALTINDCLIRGFSFSGIQVQAALQTLSVHGCTILYVSGNSAAGINQTGGGATQSVSVEDSLLEGNTSGIIIAAAARFLVTDTTLSGNESVGIDVDVETGAGNSASLVLKRCTIVHSSSGIHVFAAQGNTASATISRNVIAFNAIGVFNVPNSVQTFNNNSFGFNTTDIQNTATAQSLQ